MIFFNSSPRLWVEENAVIISWENKPAILSFISDITPRKRLEALNSNKPRKCAPWV